MHSMLYFNTSFADLQTKTSNDKKRPSTEFDMLKSNTTKIY